MAAVTAVLSVNETDVLYRSVVMEGEMTAVADLGYRIPGGKQSGYRGYVL